MKLPNPGFECDVGTIGVGGRGARGDNCPSWIQETAQIQAYALENLGIWGGEENYIRKNTKNRYEKI